MKLSTLALCSVLGLGLAGAAHAECNEEQEANAGMLAGGAAHDKIAPVIDVKGKQMVSITNCDMRGPKFAVDYKFNFIGADGYYWAEISAVIDPSGKPTAFRITKSSPNFQAAAGKAPGGPALLASK